MQEILDFHSKFSEENSIDFWVNKVKNDSIAAEIISSDAFQRLEDISFLGSLDYIGEHSKEKKVERSRACHSLHVAALASYVSFKRNYSKELTDHLVASALLHDVGHPPFSHSAEPSIKKQLGYGHHEMGEQIIRGKEDSVGVSLNKILARYLDVDFVIDLLNKKIDPADGGDLFSSQINIDTIDGIIRSLGYFSKIESTLTIEIAAASFLGDSRSSAALDNFWLKKNFVYNKIINSRQGILQDKICELYFVNEEIFSEEDFIKKESALKRRYKSLFYALKNSYKLFKYPEWIDGEVIGFTHREYTINPDENGVNRYQAKKIKKKLEINNEYIYGEKTNERPFFSRISNNCQRDFFL
jgi:hypothetical protein